MASTGFDAAATAFALSDPQPQPHCRWRYATRSRGVAPDGIGKKLRPARGAPSLRLSIDKTGPQYAGDQDCVGNLNPAARILPRSPALSMIFFLDARLL